MAGYGRIFLTKPRQNFAQESVDLIFDKQIDIDLSLCLVNYGSLAMDNSFQVNTPTHKMMCKY